MEKTPATAPGPAPVTAPGTSVGARIKAVSAKLAATVRSWPTPLTVTAAVVLVLLVAIPVWRGVATFAAQASFAAAANTFGADENEAESAVASARGTLAEARTLLSISKGKVLAEDSRTALAAALDKAESTFSPVDGMLATAQKASVTSFPDTSLLLPGSGLQERAAVLTSFHTSGLNESTEVSGSVVEQLTGPINDVRAAMAAWKAEQERILRERYTNNVHAVGWLDELDECAGSVDVTSHYLDIPTIAEHWSCGGKNFPTEAGTLITLTGKISGTYEVQGISAMLSATRNDANDLPRDYDLLYQTCQNGNSSTMSFIGLTKID